MGKSKKQQQKKQQGHSVFKVAGSKISKSKNKPKAVTTNLKRMNISTRNQTESMDAEFQEVSKSLLKPTADDKQRKETTKVAAQSSTVKTRDEAPPDIAKTVEDLAKL